MSGKPSGNMFAAAVQQRQREQQKIEATVTGGTSREPVRARKRGDGATTMTLAISREDKAVVKTWAARHSTTVSDLLHGWIAEHCKD